MIITSTISAILNHKGAQVWSIPPEMMVFDAIQLMADKNVGALLVMSGDKLLGVMSERDYTAKGSKGKSSKQTPVRKFYPVRLLPPAHLIPSEDCMRLMTENRVRHLPILTKIK